MSVLPKPTGLEIRLTMAPALYGSNLSWMLLGMIFMQTYTYYRHSHHDRRPFRTFVYTAVLLEVVATGLECYVGYRYLVGGWGDPTGDAVEVPPKAFLFQPLLDAVLGTMVQCFFAWRIWSFGAIGTPKMHYLTNCISWLILILSFVALSCAIAFPILFFRVDLQPELWTTTRPAVITWTITSAVVDIAISICMVVILHHARSRSYFEETRDMISRLIRLTIQTGALTSLLAVSIIVVFLTEPFGNMHTFPAYLLGKSYAMSLLANVNARVQRQTTKRHSITSTQPPLAFSPPRSRRHAFDSTLNAPFSTIFTEGRSTSTANGTANSVLGTESGIGTVGKIHPDELKSHSASFGIDPDVIQLRTITERDGEVRCLSDYVV